MAANGKTVPPGDIQMVMDVTGFGDRAMIANALRNRGNVESVINEYLDDAAKFRRQYGWDEAAFSSGRDGEELSGASNANIPSFAIHPPVIYGTEPTSTLYGAPSRPPSRANNRSPMSRLVDLTHGEYNTDTPSNRQEEEAQLQRAISESLSASGVQTPQVLPPPHPPPLPQQTGVMTANGDSSSVCFGPANRPDYDPDEWAMVRLGGQESDPEPSLRARKLGVPVLLRCRMEGAWRQHRIGALLMILQQIPAARNILLQSGEAPGHGYGNKSDWWLGKPILPPGQSETVDEWGDPVVPPWSDELHRLIAFLESSERAYGTADLLARATYGTTRDTGDIEKDFFQSFSEAQSASGSPEGVAALMSSVEVVGLEDLSPQCADSFGLLDLQVGKDAVPPPESLYTVLDWLFFTDLRQAREDPSIARMAWVDGASEILTFRFQGDEGLPAPLDMPETFYLDRYMKINGEKTQELQMDMVSLSRAYDANIHKEEGVIKWVNPQTHKVYDRRIMTKATIDRCRDKVNKIRTRAFWRDHEQATAAAADGEGEGAYYLPHHAGDPNLLPDEASVVSQLEANIRELEGSLAEMERVMNEVILPERQAILDMSRKMASLLTVPSTDERWNPSHKYTLRGVVNEANTVYQRMCGPVQEPATEDATAPAPTEEGWWKTSFKTEDNTVEHTSVSFEAVMREACGAGSQPILVYATDSALEQQTVPLSEALNTFVRLDNRHFKQELSQSARLGQSPDKKRSAVLGGNDPQSKRRQRSGSMDSMATNQASAGDLDEDMRDAPFDNDSLFGQHAGGDAAVAAAAAQSVGGIDNDGIPDLVELAPAWSQQLPTTTVTALPSYEDDNDDVEMGSTTITTTATTTGSAAPAQLDPEAARLAQVSLKDFRSGDSSSNPPSRVLEMQERSNAQFFTRLVHNDGSAAAGAGAANGTTTAAAADAEMPPLIDLSDETKSPPEPKVNGV